MRGFVSIVSDLHLDLLHTVRRKHILELIRNAGEGEPLILAGDIASPHWIKGREAWKELVSSTRDRYKELLLVMGNHEHYNGSLEETKSLIPSEVKVLDREIWSSPDGFDVLGCTLWSHIPSTHQAEIAHSFSDYYEISRAGRPFTVEDHNELHQTDLSWLKGELFARAQVPSVVATHHAPLLNEGCSDSKYVNRNGNYFFESDQRSLIEATCPNLWICGHTHHRTVFQYSKTKIVLNCLGYDNELKESFKVRKIHVL